MNPEVFDAAFMALPEEFRTSHPAVAAVLGSGWNRAIASLRTLCEIPYGSIPGMGKATVAGHDGKLVLAALPDGARVLIFSGRRHWYEGATWEAVTMPAILSKKLGSEILLLTNAAGGISRSLRAGDIVALKDHIRLCALSPLRGEHFPEFGPRFPDQSQVYDPELRKLLQQAGRTCGAEICEGVYAYSGGPAFETPSEVKAYGLLGADLVGMSTVPEAMVASSAGMRVAALSFVSNAAAGIADKPLDGADVVECAQCASTKLAAVLAEALRLFAELADRSKESVKK